MGGAIAFKALLVWLAIMAAAVLNGAFRVSVLIPALGGTLGQPVSSVIFAAVILLLTWIFLGWTGRLTRRNAWLVGLSWFALTVIFETGLGLVQGMPPGDIAALYNPLSPGLRDLVLLVTLLAPPLLNGVARR